MDTIVIVIVIFMVHGVNGFLEYFASLQYVVKMLSAKG